MIRLALVIVALGTGLTGAYQAFPTQQRSEPSPAPAAAPAEAAAFGVPVGGPNFAQVPPPGFPASFNVSYTGPDGNFATTCYYTGVSQGEILRWTSVPVRTASLSGAVEISFHSGVKVAGGAWWVDVGNANSGMGAGPTAFGKFGHGYIRVN